MAGPWVVVLLAIVTSIAVLGLLELGRRHAAGVHLERDLRGARRERR
jgi:hypothetical protein